MSFRFFKRFKVAPGLWVNLSKSGPSLSVGPRGAKVTLGPKGVRTTVGIPGTGVHYTKHHPHGERAGSSVQPRQSTQQSTRQSPRNSQEQSLLSACEALDQQQTDAALDHLRLAASLPDACWMAGFLLIKKNQPGEAVPAFEAALAHTQVLGESFTALGVEIAMVLPVTPQFSLSLAPAAESAALGLVEALQGVGNPLRAVEMLRSLQASDPRNPIVSLSLTELTWDTWKHDRQALEYILEITNGFEGDDDLHVSLLLFRARALRELGHLDAAREILMRALRRTKGRSRELLLALRYDRALVYEARGELQAATKELERIVALDSGYEDVLARLSR